MTLYVLDTDMLTLLEEGHPAVARRFLEQRPGDAAITVLSVEEQLSGWYHPGPKSQAPREAGVGLSPARGRGWLPGPPAHPDL
jgi:hypothetical protein